MAAWLKESAARPSKRKLGSCSKWCLASRYRNGLVMIIVFFAAAGAVSAALLTGRPVPVAGRAVLPREVPATAAVPAEAAVPVPVSDPDQVPL